VEVSNLEKVESGRRNGKKIARERTQNPFGLLIKTSGDVLGINGKKAKVSALTGRSMEQIAREQTKVGTAITGVTLPRIKPKQLRKEVTGETLALTQLV